MKMFFEEQFEGKTVFLTTDIVYNVKDIVNVFTINSICFVKIIDKKGNEILINPLYIVKVE